MSTQKELIVITGASSGIGEATAKLFVQSNDKYRVLLLARRTDRLEALLQEDNSPLNKSNALAVTCDVTNRDQVIQAIQQAKDYFGSDIQVNLLVNNAGVMYLDLLAEQPHDRIETMVQTNIMGVLNGIQAVLQDMIKRETGTIINISSVAGRKAFPNHVAYCATKFAVHGLSEALREEVSGSNVRVMCVAPGVTSTELLSHNDEKQMNPYEEWKANELKGEVLQSVDVAQTIKFVYEMPPHVCIREVVMAPTRQKN